MPDIDVEINGRVYRLACGEGQERRVHALAKRLDGFARQVATQAGGFSEMRVLLMAGLMATDALDEAETEANWLREAAASRDAVTPAKPETESAPKPKSDPDGPEMREATSQ